MKLKIEEVQNLEEQTSNKCSSSSSLYKKIIKDRLNFIEESVRVIKESIDHLESEDESDD